MGLLFVLLCVLLLPSIARAQDTTRPPIPPPADTTLPTPRPDSIVAGVGGGSDLDEPIIYSADYIRFNLDKKKAYLTGNASVQKGSDRLRAAYIEVDFETEELYAESRFDSATDTYIGVPLLDYEDQQLSALTLKYNFKTGRGVSSAAEIVIPEGRLSVERFKKVSDDVIFAQNGTFTTCDALDPHYFFKASKMKLEGSAAIYADRLQMYIEDVPVVTLPVGFFFAFGGGRHSGILLPDINVTDTRGVELNNLGYFWVINEYLDATFLTDLTSKGGYNFDGQLRGALRGIIHRSELNLGFGRTRTDPTQPLVNSFEGDVSLDMSLGEQTRIGGTLVYKTKDAPRLRTSVTSLDPFADNADLATQNINSDFKFSSRISPFDIPIDYTLDYSRTLDIVTQEVKPERYTFAVNPPKWTPFSRSDIPLLQSLQLGISPRYVREFRREDTIPGGGFRSVTTKQGISLNPSISLSGNLGYFTISPRLNTNSSIFFRRIVLQPNGSAGVDTTYVNGVYAPFWYSFGFSVKTALYGIVQPRIFGINAIRHRLAPSIALSIQPDFSDPSYGYYDRYFNPRTNSIVPYSIFSADNIVSAPFSQGASRRLEWGLDNDFDAKISRGDTLEDRELKLLSLNLRGSYDLADSLTPISDITASAYTNLDRIGSFTANATFSPYQRVPDGEINPPGIPLPFPYVRLTQTNFSFTTSFSDKGFNDSRFIYTRPDTFSTERKAHVDRPAGYNPAEFYGERVRGNSTFRVPWSLGLRGTYVLTPQDTGAALSQFSLIPSLSFTLTPTTEIMASASINLTEGDILYPSIELEKDLHDWIMRFKWQPTGIGEGFFFSIGFTPSLLRELQQDFRF